jgi:hypothetical protein
MRTYDGTGELDVDELEKCWGVKCWVDETCVVHRGGWRRHGGRGEDEGSGIVESRLFKQIGKRRQPRKRT